MGHHLTIRSAILASAFSTLALTPPAIGAVFCVETPSELQTALESAGNNSQADEIEIATGSYVGPFTYVPNVHAPTIDVTLRGGFAKVAGNCEKVTDDPIQTILRSTAAAPALELDVVAPSAQTSHVLIEKLSFSASIAGGSGGLHVNADADGTLDLEVSATRTEFLDGEPLRLDLNGSVVLRFVNNLIVKNGIPEISPVPFGVGVFLSGGAAAEIAHNTVTDNAGRGLVIECNGATGSVLIGNILYRSLYDYDDLDTTMFTGCAINYARYNFIGKSVADNFTSGTCCNALDTDPELDKASGFQLKPTSPAIDVVAESPSTGAVNVDILGAPRPFPSTGLRDAGAFELQGIFDDGFESGDTTAWSSSTT